MNELGYSVVAYIDGGKPPGLIPRADLILSAAYTRILGEAELGRAPLALNVHPSLLPAYRGSYPVYWALFEGQTTIGVTVHQMTGSVDRGPIVAQRAMGVDPKGDPEIIYDEVARLAEDVLRDVLHRLEAGPLKAVSQVGEGSYRAHPSREQERLILRWDLSSEEILRRVRIFSGWVAISEAGRLRPVSSARFGRKTGFEPGKRIGRNWAEREYAAGDGVSVRVKLVPPRRLRRWVRRATRLRRGGFASRGPSDSR